MRAWKPTQKSLLLIGPSGGYTLDTEFLRKFDRITAVDPDPCARWIFERSHRGLQVEWDHSNYFTDTKTGLYESSRLTSFLERHSDSALLFSNFLGQLRFLNDSEEGERSLIQWKRALPSLLAGRSWASYHDRLSGAPRPVCPNPKQTTDSPLTNAELVRRYYVGQPGELADHLTEGLFCGHEASYWSWELYPGSFHLIEGCRATA